MYIHHQSRPFADRLKSSHPDRVLKLRVTYHRAADLAADRAAQFAKGGLLVRVAPPPGLALFDQVRLELVAGGARATLAAQVVQTAPQAIAVMFDGAAAAGLASALDADTLDADPVHELVDEAAEDAAAAQSPATPRGVNSGNSAGGANSVNSAKRIQQALHGNRDERAAIMRDVNKQLHLYVLKNPQLGADEVLAIAKMSTMSAEVLAQIAARREWASRQDVAIALVRNAKTPASIAIKLLDYVGTVELRQLAKDTRTRAPIQQAARKKII